MSSTLCPMWFISVLALLAVDVRTGALQQRDMEPRRCHQCIRLNLTTCEQTSSWKLTTCTADQPYCATIAVGPDFGPILTCAAPPSSTCELKYSSNRNIQITCVCNDSKCNVPFSRDLRSELIKFSNANLNNTKENITHDFFKQLKINLTDIDVYKRITADIQTTEIPDKNSSKLTTFSVSTVLPTVVLGHTVNVIPRAEALKQGTAAPSDDDEDESEGSGSYEEAHSHQAAPPAAPSSFLPANDNKATPLFTNVLLLIPILVHLV